VWIAWNIQKTSRFVLIVPRCFKPSEPGYNGVAFLQGNTDKPEPRRRWFRLPFMKVFVGICPLKFSDQLPSRDLSGQGRPLESLRGLGKLVPDLIEFLFECEMGPDEITIKLWKNDSHDEEEQEGDCAQHGSLESQ